MSELTLHCSIILELFRQRGLDVQVSEWSSHYWTAQKNVRCCKICSLKFAESVSE